MTNFEMRISRKRWELWRKMSKKRFYRYWYLPSNGTIVNVVLSDLDLKFQPHKFETLISQKPWELSQKMHHMTFAEVIIRQRIAPWWMLYFATLTFVSRSNNYIFLLCICHETKCVGSGCPQQICLDSHGPRRGVALVTCRSLVCLKYVTIWSI